MPEPGSIRVLILCTHNSARSQMAEAILRRVGGDRYEVASAGTQPSRVHPLAIAAIAKRGIDVTAQRSKHVNELAGRSFDYVVTVCDAAAEACPIFAGPARRIHWSMPDPSSVEGGEAARLAAFERTAGDLWARLRGLVEEIEGRPGTQ
jgi:arsenate reductase